MHSVTANEDSRLLLWQRVRDFAVPPSMIKSATARRDVGDWAGACAAARVDVDLNLRALARAYGQELVSRVRADLRHLAPDLLRWHMPRIAPDGLLRPGLTISLAVYESGDIHLVARTPPAWADAGQRISLALWDASQTERGDAHPDRRFRLDLHRHLWDVRQAGELRVRSGADIESTVDETVDDTSLVPAGCAAHRWAAEVKLLLRAEGRHDGDAVSVRVGNRRRLMLRVSDGALTIAPARAHAGPILPDAATWVLPDLTLLRAGRIDAGRLHPLVAAALVPGYRPETAQHAPLRGQHLVECRGAQHRIGLVNGVLVPLDHDPAELRREELLAALHGRPMPCLQVIDEVHRNPASLADVRDRLDHGDSDGAIAVIEALLGPDALLRDGPLHDELRTAALRRIDHGLYRAGLAEFGPQRSVRDGRPRGKRAHPRHAVSR